MQIYEKMSQTPKKVRTAVSIGLSPKHGVCVTSPTHDTQRQTNKSVSARRAPYIVHPSRPKSEMILCEITRDVVFLSKTKHTCQSDPPTGTFIFLLLLLLLLVVVVVVVIVFVSSIPFHPTFALSIYNVRNSPSTQVRHRQIHTQRGYDRRYVRYRIILLREVVR